MAHQRGPHCLKLESDAAITLLTCQRACRRAGSDYCYAVLCYVRCQLECCGAGAGCLSCWNSRAGQGAPAAARQTAQVLLDGTGILKGCMAQTAAPP